MKYKRSIIGVVVLGVLLLLLSLEMLVEASRKEFIRFGTVVENPNGLWNKALELHLDNKDISFYHDKQNEQHVYLSIIEQDEEQILWESDRLYPPLAQSPPHVLMTGLLNEYEEPDLLLCYTDDCGTGSNSYCWKQTLRLFFDWQPGGSEPLEISSIDRYIKIVDEKTSYSIDEDGGPAKERKSLVMICPASKNEPLHIYLWSRMEIFDHPPTHTQQTVTYQIMKYKITDEQVVFVENIEGGLLQTSELLRSILWSKREQEEEPLLCNFNGPKPYLLDENNWFQYFQTLEIFQ